MFSPNAPVTVVRIHVRMTPGIGALVFAGEDAVFVACVNVAENLKDMCRVRRYLLNVRSAFTRIPSNRLYLVDIFLSVCVVTV
uniref:Uncharacterized protein n=1 Tax=Pararge aegeria TaxID=116150 RepID=S4PSY5_9NEOP